MNKETIVITGRDDREKTRNLNHLRAHGMAHFVNAPRLHPKQASVAVAAFHALCDGRCDDQHEECGTQEVVSTILEPHDCRFLPAPPPWKTYGKEEYPPPVEVSEEEAEKRGVDPGPCHHEGDWKELDVLDSAATDHPFTFNPFSGGIGYRTTQHEKRLYECEECGMKFARWEIVQ